jgi:3-oxoacyl-[acyl-carrier protein] reductase
VVFITGGGSGLGAAAARRLAGDGALVAVNDLDAESAGRVASEIGGVSYGFDVCDARAFGSAIDDCVTRFGQLDVLVNNAGIAPSDVGSKTDRMISNQMKRMENRLDEYEPMNYLIDLTDEAWDVMIRTHLYGCFHGCRAALRHMQARRYGRIINISSVLGLKPSAGAPHYSTAKAAIIALTRAVADEVAPLGITVNAICPGYIDTPLLTPFSEMLKAAIVSRIGMGRMGTAAEIAEMVRFLAGPEASYCTGEVYPVTGGYLG